jgi:adenosylcobinamide amidohydrolase
MLSSPSFVTRFRVEARTLVIDLGAPRLILSSAPRNGGVTRSRYILNHQVLPNPVGSSPVRTCSCADPTGYLGQVATDLGVKGRSVALMTAVPMRQLVTRRMEADDLWLEGFLTVGVTNAMRAGQPARPHGGKRLPFGKGRVSARLGRVGAMVPGTINIILVTNARLAKGAMVEAVQVITEAKAAALASQAVPTWTGLPGATGTGTDAVVVVSGAGKAGPSLRYCGTHTKMGELIGSLVARGVSAGLDRSKHW